MLTLYNLDLQSKTEMAGAIHAEGKAGTRDDRSVDFQISLDRIPIDEWLPRGWNEHVKGAASGKISWKGENRKLETSRGEAFLRIEEGRISSLPFLEKIATLTGAKELERLKLNMCKLDVEWRYPKADVKNLLVEDEGKFRAEGEVTIQKKAVAGAIQLGVARRLLDWLPKAEEVFSREHDGYMWTTVHLSGTIDAPEQDLSPRIMEAIKESPGAALGILFRQFGEWLKERVWQRVIFGNKKNFEQGTSDIEFFEKFFNCSEFGVRCFFTVSVVACADSALSINSALR